MRGVERKILGIVREIIGETAFGSTLDGGGDEGWMLRRMAGTVVKLWAEIFRGEHLLGIDNDIGVSLQVLADASDEVVL